MNLDRWGMARENAYQKLEQEAQIQIYRRRLLDSGVIVEEEFINGKAVDMDDAKRAYEVLAEIQCVFPPAALLNWISRIGHLIALAFMLDLLRSYVY